MTVRDSSLVTLKEPQDYEPALGAKRGSETGTRLVSRLGWPALRTNGLLQPQLARRPLNPRAFAERSAPLEAHPHAPEFLRAQRRIHATGPIHESSSGVPGGCSRRLKVHRKSLDLSGLRPVNRMASLPP